MENTLLKDHPESAEKVESSYTFKQDLIDAKSGGINHLIEVIAEFVNRNYIPKK